MARFISVVSGKGGVGKTTTAVNLGIALAEHTEVIVADCDFNNPNLSIHLAMPRSEFDVYSTMRQRQPVRLEQHPSGISVLPASLAARHQDTIRGHHVKRLLYLLNKKEQTVLLDGPPGSTDVKMMLAHEDMCLVITHPQTSACVDALKTIHLCEQMGVTVLGVIVNRVVGDKYELTEQQVSTLVGKPILMKIPEDPAMRKAMARKSPVTISYPKAKSSKAYFELARILKEMI